MCSSVGVPRRALRDRDHREVGHDVTRWDVELRGSPLAPSRDGDHHGVGPALQLAGFLDAAPRFVGIAGATGAHPHVLALVACPGEAASLVELVGQPIVHVEQVGHVGRGVVELGVGERTSEPIRQPIGLGDPHAEDPVVHRRERR